MVSRGAHNYHAMPLLAELTVFFVGACYKDSAPPELKDTSLVFRFFRLRG